MFPEVIFSAMIWPLWLITKCSLRPKNHPHLAIPTATPLEPLASFAHGGLAAGGQAVEPPMSVDAAIVAGGELARIPEVDARLLAAEAVQQYHQRHEQPRHQADE